MPKSATLTGIKTLRCYTIPEVAEVTGVSERTVRAWIKRGLAAMAGERPTLVRGDELISFIKRERAARKFSLAEDQLYCLRCRAPSKAAGGIADCEINGQRAKLTAICVVCEAMMHRPIPLAAVPAQSEVFDLTLHESPTPARASPAE